MTSSHKWRLYFEQNARSLLNIPWHVGPELTAEETAVVAQSLREFQAGESSEGKHLFRYAEEYFQLTGDREYLAAIRLFIREEQRHGRDLGRFLTLNHIAPVRTTMTDRVFRKLRNLLGGLESSIAVLITAEIIAKVYYAVLREATQSAILRRLCEQILGDERRHVEFQSQQLARLRQERGKLRAAAARAFQRVLYFGATVVVGVNHAKVIRRGGMSFRSWWHSCWREFDDAFALSSPEPAQQPVEAHRQHTRTRRRATTVRQGH